MDTISKYQQIIEKIIGEYAKLRYSDSEVERKTVFDREQNHYLLMIVGVEGHKMVHGCILHLEIIDDKIWIHRDGIEDGIAGELLAEGVPKDKIVLGFYTPEKRKITDFAVC
ncbi:MULTISPECIES: XisI protein [unclassified Okeania]|uniref:XisI protein n=1 Tax=unclassified Okeania TaxID=2634635 RepID=UPI0013BB8B58|nr:MULTISPECIES: XisI protein [unclassified Okeania]NEP05814.1 XisI protein [Okeania sp. SIO4D6]NEP44513.1 XisI protein [Okeania sp. SIO2H7]NEP71652.1 XisI protein [Okeania sp. SIO2G5]NEP91747.1 XisI protein [Okeania sp. SIO2F5]NEQ89574.1 XisI protein [Okeania sp. SIO2G4]